MWGEEKHGGSKCEAMGTGCIAARADGEGAGEGRAREELVLFSVQQSLEDVVGTMAAEAETHSTRVDDVSILRSHAHRSKIDGAATAALECKNAY